MTSHRQVQRNGRREGNRRGRLPESLTLTCRPSGPQGCPVNTHSLWRAGVPLAGSDAVDGIVLIQGHLTGLFQDIGLVGLDRQ